MVRVKKALRIGLLLLVLIISLLFLSRNLIVKKIFSKTSARIKNRYGLTVTASAVEVKGLNTLQLQNLLIVDTDTLLCSESFRIKLNPFHLVLLKINPKQIYISRTTINIDNLIALASKHTLQSANEKKNESSSNKRLYRLVKAFFGLSTATFNINDLYFTYSDSAYTGKVTIEKWSYSNNNFTSTLNLNDGDRTSRVTITGTTSKRKNSLTATVTTEEPGAYIPFTKPVLGVKASFKKIFLDLNATHIEPGRIELNLVSSINSLLLDGKRIAQMPVIIDSCKTNMQIRVMPNSFVIDSLSTVSINGFKAKLGFEYRPLPSRYVWFTLNTGENSWQSLFDALPKGLFTNLSGIKVNGTFSYSLQVGVPLTNPDSLTIAPNLKSKGFYVLSYGNTNLAMLADTFTHRAYIDNVYVRDIKVNPKSASYASLDQISPYLQWAVITSEDGGFYNHRGFSLDGITYAMACNIREKRFARGGSTITQQLVKNVFLNQSKNIGRKAEEILITWITENSGVVSKERMLEVYLNIIEWGPDVYGIREASQYYFGKKPSSLTLPEALFLAYIIPRPTKFRYLFDTEGMLKPFVTESFMFVANKMLNRGNITQQDYDNLATYPQVTLTGPAKDLLKKESSSDNIDSEANFTEQEKETN